LAYRSFAPDDFDAGVNDFVTKLASRDRAAVAKIKKLVAGADQRSLAEGLDDEIAAVVAHITDHGVHEFRRVGASS
jgi:2-(1,2-epoxy-1,2-dihydrophenyl)acetyl-CoA isomerase